MGDSDATFAERVKAKYWIRDVSQPAESVVLAAEKPGEQDELKSFETDEWRVAARIPHEKGDVYVFVRSGATDD